MTNPLQLVGLINKTDLAQADKVKIVRMLAAFSTMASALAVANTVLGKHRFAGTDQNPKGINDLVGHAAGLAERALQ